MLPRFLAIGMLAAAGVAAAQSIMRVPRIGVSELHDLVAEKAVVVIDVRSTDRYRMQHIPGALSVPLGTEKRFAEQLSKETRPIVTYCTCSAEQTAALSAINFAALGVENVKALRGGLAAWEKAGHPME